MWLRALNIPTVDGIVISKWSRTAAVAVERFCRKMHSGKVLIRFDRHGQRWTNRRGGYIADASQVEGVVRSLQGEETLVLCLEPVSPFADLYSLAAITDPDRSKMTVEIVGPGFDASDILRSDVQPHERFEVALRTFDRSSLAGSEVVKVKRTFLVSNDAYVASVKVRLQKIAAKLQNPMKAPAVQRRGKRAAMAAAEYYLRRTGESLLLEHRDAYTPVPRPMLHTFLQYVLQALDGLALNGLRLGPTSFAASFITFERIVIWDFFPARAEEMLQLTDRR
jgi:hypothetical protein